MTRTTSLILAILTLTSGIYLYLCYRPTSLLVFHWLDAVGLKTAADILRSNAPTLPKNWIIFSLPYALWVVSYLFSIRAIWGAQTASQWFWVWCVPVLAIATEISQISEFVPGSYDPIDLVVLVLATVITLALICPEHFCGRDIMPETESEPADATPDRSSTETGA